MKTLNIPETQQVSGGILDLALMIYAGANQWNFPKSIAGYTLYSCGLGVALDQSGILFEQFHIVLSTPEVLKAAALSGVAAGTLFYGIGYMFSGSSEPVAA